MRYLLNCVGYLVGNADIAEAAFDIDMSLSGIKNKNCIPPCLQLFNDVFRRKHRLQVRDIRLLKWPWSWNKEEGQEKGEDQEIQEEGK
jgi:hypothetical protein